MSEAEILEKFRSEGKACRQGGWDDDMDVDALEKGRGNSGSGSWKGRSRIQRNVLHL